MKKFVITKVLENTGLVLTPRVGIHQSDFIFDELYESFVYVHQVSDEPITKKDYFVDQDGRIYKANVFEPMDIDKKIISTTNQLLIKDGVSPLKTSIVCGIHI